MRGVEKKSNSLFGSASYMLRLRQFKIKHPPPFNIFRYWIFPLLPFFAVALFRTLCHFAAVCVCVCFLYFFIIPTAPRRTLTHTYTHIYVSTHTYTRSYTYTRCRLVLVLRKVLRRYRSADEWRTRRILISRKTKINVGIQKNVSILCMFSLARVCCVISKVGIIINKSYNGYTLANDGIYDVYV